MKLNPRYLDCSRSYTVSIWGLLAISMLLHSTLSFAQAPMLSPIESTSPFVTLVPEESFEAEIRSGERHSFAVNLKHGGFASIVVEQRGADIRLIDNGSEPMDRVRNTWGVEEHYIVSTSIGHILRVEAGIAQAGASYRIRVEPLSVTTACKESLISAEQYLDLAVRSIALQQVDGIRAGVESLLRVEVQCPPDQGNHLAAYAGFLQAKTLQSLSRGSEAMPLVERVAKQYLDIEYVPGMAATEALRGALLQGIGKREDATESLMQALTLWRKSGNMEGEASTLNLLSIVYSSLGETELAKNSIERAHSLFQQMGNRLGEGYTKSNLAWHLYSKYGEKDKAVSMLTDALHIHEANDHLESIGATRTKLGLISLRSGEYGRARLYFQESLAIHSSLGDRSGVASCIHNLGLVALAERNYTQALNQLQKALATSRQVLDPGPIGTNLHSIGLVYEGIGQQDVALEYYKEALQVRKSISVSDAAAEAETIADLYAKTGRHRDAEEYYLLAVESVEKMRQQSGAFEQRALFFQRRQSACEKYISFLFRGRERIQDALTTFERCHSLSLVDGLKSKRDSHSLKPSGDIAYPRRTASSSKLQSLQNILDPDTLLLEFMVGANESYLWVVSPESINGFILPGRAQIDSLAREVHQALSERGRDSPHEAEDDRLIRLERADVGLSIASQRLSQLLLGPASHQLSTVKRLAIVADGTLSYIPFSILPVPFKENGEPLVVTHEIVYIPSATVLSVLREQRQIQKAASGTIAIMADPVFSAQDPRVRRSKAPIAPSSKHDQDDIELPSLAQLQRTRAIRESTGGSEILDRLPGTRLESERIRAEIPWWERRSDLLRQASGFDVNRSLLESGDLANYRILHFATHGLVNEEHPELSGLILSLVNEQGESQENSFLRLKDLFNHKLNADLVVLSACQTNLGKNVSGEGLIGLTTGFMYAGTPRVIASLWNVQDQATAELMGRFYRLVLRKKLRPARALHEAQLSMWQDDKWHHPYYWAAFTLQGDWR